MKAAVLHAVGEPMRLEETRLAAPRADEVLVRVRAAGVCHSDLHYLNGDLTSGCRSAGPAARTRVPPRRHQRGLRRLPTESVGRGLILMGD